MEKLSDLICCILSATFLIPPLSINEISAVRLILFSLFICITVLPACKKSKAVTAIPDGKYTGTFQREPPSGVGPISHIKLNFFGNTFSGESDMEKYPAVCHGTYNITNDTTASFNNGCVWTANFDWSLIVSQQYTLQLSGSNLQLTRLYVNGSKDVYQLKKQY